MSENKFQKLLEERKTDYGTWVPVFCPALREYVYFNAQGFNHLRFKIDNTPRNPKEAMYKLGLLPLVRSVIHLAVRVDKYERRLSPMGGSRKKVYKEIEYWGLIEVVGKQDVKIRVVLRKIVNSDRIHFWSVMKG
ncbi:MAG: hypothetical protein A2937_01530 [Candidatus Yonathbacteria bacterium RIFCSPLOWO2_01_FULL_47_33b]|uniref:Uncharacterized protein n=1 Tax=Candidatus Yonathbacteria bacterium RIFCSPLOWO2_01_FULL_47_33b TaxID=1802727 RepID=A0A1G2SI38_9BACT|nr:MAG: hypothetical protein A2937_01530 [Candidatus Yonathbacteria bacterium RIFCSPLOWO2_01_FULL_47_33b]